MNFINTSVLRDYFSRLPYPPTKYNDYDDYRFDTDSDTDSDMAIEGLSSPPRNARVEANEAVSHIPQSENNVSPRTPKKQTLPYASLQISKYTASYTVLDVHSLVSS